MNNEQLTHLKHELQRKRSDLEELLTQESGVEAEELSSVDNHPADSATDLMMQTTDMAIEELREEEVAEIEAALEAIEDGTYGKCEVCGEAIPYERLEALPTARTCVEHA